MIELVEIGDLQCGIRSTTNNPEVEASFDTSWLPMCCSCYKLSHSKEGIGSINFKAMLKYVLFICKINK